MPSQITITAPTGPGLSVSGLVISNPRLVAFDIANQALAVTDANDNVTNYDLHATSTITCSVSAGVFTFVVSHS